MVLIMGASQMNHVPALAFTMLALVSLARWDRGSTTRERWVHAGVIGAVFNRAKFGDFHGAGVNVHAVKAVLNRVTLEMVGCAVVNIVEVRRKRGSRADNLSHHAYGKCA